MVVSEVLLRTNMRLRLAGTVHAVPLAWACGARFKGRGRAVVQGCRGMVVNFRAYL